MGYLLILGAKSDIARAVARVYAGAGYDLYLAARQARSLERFAGDLAVRTGRDVKCLELDILDFESHGGFYGSLTEKPAGVFSAVGYLGNQHQAEGEWAEAKRILDTNYTGITSLLSLAARDFEARKSGFIIAISSVAGDRGRRSNYIYGAAKAALSTFLSGLRSRLHGAGVPVLTVKPGFVATRMTSAMTLPKFLTASPETVARDIFRAHRKKKEVIYTLGIWRWIMLLLRSIPERLFKTLDL